MSFRILIVDDSFGGHQEEYLSAIASLKLEAKWVFLVHPKMCSILSTLHPNIACIEFDQKYTKKGFFSSWSNFFYIRRIGKKQNIKNIFFCFFDVAIIPILFCGLWDCFQGYKYQGIFFRNPVWKIHSLDRNVKVIMQSWVKSLCIRFLVLLPSVKYIFCLDEFYVNKIKQKKVVYLPDPIAVIGSLSSDPRSKNSQLSFLCFGYQDSRKGTVLFLDSLGRVLADSDVSIIVRIIGKSNPAYEQCIENSILALQRYPHVLIERRREYISIGQLEALVESSDVLVACYQDFYWSSGVVNWAIGFKKRIFTSRLGYIGTLSERLAPDSVAKSLSLNDLGAALQEILRQPNYTPDQLLILEEYANFFHKDKFKSVLLKGLN